MTRTSHKHHGQHSAPSSFLCEAVGCNTRVVVDASATTRAMLKQRLCAVHSAHAACGAQIERRPPTAPTAEQARPGPVDRTAKPTPVEPHAIVGDPLDDAQRDALVQKPSPPIPDGPTTSRAPLPTHGPAPSSPSWARPSWSEKIKRGRP